MVLLPTPQPSQTRGALNGGPRSWDQRQTWGHAGDKSGLLVGVGERTETAPTLSGPEEKVQVLLGCHDTCALPRGPFDGVLGSPGLLAGTTSEASPIRGAGPPWIWDSCVAFMGHDQWLKAWAGSRKPSSWAGILIKLGLLGLAYREFSTRLCLSGPSGLVISNATCRAGGSRIPCLSPQWMRTGRGCGAQN